MAQRLQTGSSEEEETQMTHDKIVLCTPSTPSNRQSGKIGWAILWLLGIPLPVLLVIYLIIHH
jgi:hypothetical protein